MRRGLRVLLAWVPTAVGALALTPLIATADASADSVTASPTSSWTTRGSIGARYTHPQRVAASFTAMRLHDPDSGDIPAGWFVQVEPGTGGGKLSAGWCLFGATDAEPVTVPLVAVGLKGSVLYTWGSPLGAPSGETFIGPEFDFSLLLVKVSVGYLWPVGSSGQNLAGVVTWGVGMGF